MKTKHLTLSIKQKVDTVRKLNGGMPVKRLSDEFDVRILKIYNIKSKRNSY
jgi:hypothetical protein